MEENCATITVTGSIIKEDQTSIEEITEECIGHINPTQIIQSILASIPTFFDSQQTYMSIFSNAQPSWHCTNNTNSSCISNKSNLCSHKSTDWAWDSGSLVHTSIISEWNLECSNSFITGMPSTSYFVGCLIGGLVFSTFGDSFLGRKKLLCFSSFVMSMAALASGFSPNIWVYSVFRFLSGFGRAPLAITALILITECVGKRWRPIMAMVGFTHFSLGILALTGIAYLTRRFSWRVLYLCTSIPGMVCSIMCYFDLRIETSCCLTNDYLMALPLRLFD